MTDMTIRIYFRSADGSVEDGQQDYGLEDFGGIMPAAGDLILDPGVQVGRDRHEPENRRMWSVVQRVFNPRDNGGGYIALVVEERAIGDSERSLLP
jgi:hypothetical protein